MEHAVTNTKQGEHGKSVGLPARPSPEPAPALHPALQLQQLVGNQSMQQLLRAGVIHAKLAISQPSDPDEQEADVTADRIMRSHAGAGVVAAPCSCSGEEDAMCEQCQQKKSAISRKASGGGATTASHAVLSQMRRSAGHPLDAATRAFFEPRFGRDFSAVRIHTDSSAESSARSIRAHAFTASEDIFFAPGEYAPHSDTGRRLLAHELTHVVQGSTAGTE